jgi:hypothetical protein
VLLLGFDSLALPNHQCSPAVPLEFTQYGGVAPLIAPQFLLPKSDFGFWHSVSHRTGVLVPKTSMDENGLMTTSEDEVGTSC